MNATRAEPKGTEDFTRSESSERSGVSITIYQKEFLTIRTLPWRLGMQRTMLIRRFGGLKDPAYQALTKGAPESCNPVNGC